MFFQRVLNLQQYLVLYGIYLLYRRTVLTPSALAANERGRMQGIPMPASPLARRRVHPKGRALHVAFLLGKCIAQFKKHHMEYMQYMGT